ncbi:MAG: protein phosphatase 2C domain-containing protein [Candidatus Saccharimonadales bacterium]
MSEQLKLNQQDAITGYQLHEAVSGYDFEEQASGLLLAESIRYDHNTHPNPMNVNTSNANTARDEPHQKTHGLVTTEHQVGNKTILLAQPYLYNEATPAPTPAPEPKPDPAPAPKPAPSPEPAEAPKPAPASTPNNDPAKKNPEQIKDGTGLNVGYAEKALHGHDSMLHNDELKVYGVFDGVGRGGGDPKAASQAAANGIEKAFAQHNGEFKTVSEAVDAMEIAFKAGRAEVAANGEDGKTTAAVVKIVSINGESYAILGNAGDGRIYYQPAGKDVVSLTEDQGSGSTLFNSFGATSPSQPDDFVAIKLEKGDRLMICTDGITGDYLLDRPDDKDMSRAMAMDDPQLSAKEFIKISKKSDDKSVIVIDFDKISGAAPQPKATPAPKPRPQTQSDPPTTPLNRPAPSPRSATDPSTLPHQTVTPATDPRTSKNKLKSRLGGKWSKRLAYYATKSATEVAMMPYKLFRSKDKGGYNASPLKRVGIVMIGTVGALALLNVFGPDHINSSGVTETVTTPNDSPVGSGSSSLTEKMTPAEIAEAVADQEAGR